MKSLRITLRPQGELRLPAAYQQAVQGLFYACWESALPGLHDSVWPEGEQRRKLFCFGRMEGRYRMEGSVIVFTSPVSLELRSAWDELVDIAASELRNRELLHLERNTLELTELWTGEWLRFPSRAMIRTRSPITAHETLEDGHTWYFSPEKPEWEARLAANLAAKLNALGVERPTAFHIEPAGETGKTVTQFKRTYITGYTGRFHVETDPEAMAALYYCGLGNRNSQGFGMFDIVER